MAPKATTAAMTTTPAANIPNFKTRPGRVRPRLKVGNLFVRLLKTNDALKIKYDRTQMRSTGTRTTKRSITPGDYFAENDGTDAIKCSNISGKSKSTGAERKKKYQLCRPDRIVLHIKAMGNADR